MPGMMVMLVCLAGPHFTGKPFWNNLPHTHIGSFSFTHSHQQARNTDGNFFGEHALRRHTPQTLAEQKKVGFDPIPKHQALHTSSSSSSRSSSFSAARDLHSLASPRPPTLPILQLFCFFFLHGRFRNLGVLWLASSLVGF